ncbi:MAG: pilus assembly PilX N-terminal domain-containing protein [Parcubacteria group bacterium]|jgi:hypothetical protein
MIEFCKKHFQSGREKRVKLGRFGFRKGTALAYMLVVMFIVSIILVSMLRYISSQLIFSGNRAEKEKAFQVAESGIYFYRWYLAHQVSGKTVQQIKDFWTSGNPYGVNIPGNPNYPYEVEFSDPEEGPIGRYKIEVDPPEINSTIVIVKVTGWTYREPGVQRIVQARFRRPSWSENVVLANDNMRFGPGTEIFGKIHSNKGIRFDGVAHNIVSSSLDQYDDPDHSGNNEFGVHTHVNPPPGSGINDIFRTAEAPPSTVSSRPDVFEIGRQFPKTAVDFNGLLTDLNYMKTESKIAGRGKYFNNDGAGRKIILKTDGTYDVCTVNTFSSSSKNISLYDGIVSGASGGYSGNNGNACTTSGCCAYAACGWISSSNHSRGKCVSLANENIPDEGVIFVEDNVWVEGTIDDRHVSIVAANLTGSGSSADMYIGLNNLLYTNFDGKDIIGLIAQNNVSVVRDSQDTLTIDAAIIAKDGRVGRNYYSSSYNKNKITVNGSMATNLRYGFAYTDGTGYEDRILNFDNNLLYYPPPYFPTGTEYSIDLWDEL